MAAQPPESYDEEKPFTDVFLEKAQRNPFLTFGLAGFLTALGIGAYKFKYRSKDLPVSLFLIQLRIAATSVVIGSLTAGMTYGMLKEYVFDKPPTKETKNDN